MGGWLFGWSGGGSADRPAVPAGAPVARRLVWVCPVQCVGQHGDLLPPGAVGEGLAGPGGLHLVDGRKETLVKALIIALGCRRAHCEGTRGGGGGGRRSWGRLAPAAKPDFIGMGCRGGGQTSSCPRPCLDVQGGGGIRREAAEVVVAPSPGASAPEPYPVAFVQHPSVHKFKESFSGPLAKWARAHRGRPAAQTVSLELCESSLRQMGLVEVPEGSKARDSRTTAGSVLSAVAGLGVFARLPRTCGRTPRSMD